MKKILKVKDLKENKIISITLSEILSDNDRYDIIEKGEK